MLECELSRGRRKARHVARSLSRVLVAGLVVVIAGGLVGQALRDRSVATALLMYIPLPLAGTAAVLLDAARKGRSTPPLRFGLSALGIVAIAWSAFTMLGSGTGDERMEGDREISVLHWNVQWGGGLFRGPCTWAAQRRAMLEKKPDLIVLSEAPTGDWMDRLTADLGSDAKFVGIHHDPRSPYWYRVAVCSRWPVRMESQLALPGGAAMSVVAEIGGRRLRLLVVDGISSPTRSRLPLLWAITAACTEADAAGRPFDVILGDFNTPSRSVGFDQLARLGYRLAARSARGWRGTFPSWLPVYDIDHIWLRAELRIGSCTLFSGPHADHRGQVVRILESEH